MNAIKNYARKVTSSYTLTTVVSLVPAGTRPFVFGITSLCLTAMLLIPFGLVPLWTTYDNLIDASAANCPLTCPSITWLKERTAWDFVTAGWIFSLPLAGMVSITTGLVLSCGLRCSSFVKLCAYTGNCIFLGWCARSWAGTYLIGLTLVLLSFCLNALLFTLLFPPGDRTAAVWLRDYLRKARYSLAIWVLLSVVAASLGNGNLLMSYLFTLRDVAFDSSWGVERLTIRLYYEYSPWWCSAMHVLSSSAVREATNSPASRILESAGTSTFVCVLLMPPLLIAACYCTGDNVVRKLRQFTRATLHNQERSLWQLFVPMVAVAAGVWLSATNVKAVLWQAMVAFTPPRPSLVLLQQRMFLTQYAVCRRLAKAQCGMLSETELEALLELARGNAHAGIRYWANIALASNKGPGWERCLRASLMDHEPVIRASAVRLFPPERLEFLQYSENLLQNAESHQYVRAAALNYVLQFPARQSTNRVLQPMYQIQ